MRPYSLLYIYSYQSVRCYIPEDRYLCNSCEMHCTLNCGLQYVLPNCFAQYTGCFRPFSLIFLKSLLVITCVHFQLLRNRRYLKSKNDLHAAKLLHFTLNVATFSLNSHSGCNSCTAAKEAYEINQTLRYARVRVCSRFQGYTLSNASSQIW